MGRYNLKNEENFKEARTEAEKFYSSISEVMCPYFKEEIAFNAKGLRHLKFKSDRQARSREDQYARLKLLRLAPEILKKSHTVQGVWKTKKFELQNRNSRWEKLFKSVTFFEFIAVMENIRAKVVVKEIEGGEKHFFSIIPFWGIDKVNRKRILHSGDPEHD